MPIDYLTQYKIAEQQLKDFLNQQYNLVDPNLETTKGNVVSSRDTLLNNLQGLQGGIDPSLRGNIASSFQSKIPILNQNLNKTLSNQAYKQKSQNLGEQGNVLTDALTRMQELSQNETEFNRQYQRQRGLQSFAGEEANKLRQSKLNLSNLADFYSNKGLELENSYTPTNDYSSALFRLLFGTGTALGTYKLLNRNPSFKPLNQTLRQASGYSTPLNLNTGQRLTGGENLFQSQTIPNYTYAYK